MTLKKLLVLDVNGLLIDTYYYRKPLPRESPDARVGNFYVYKRPFCDEFLEFCLENFIVGIWSSAREYNVNNLVEYVFGEAKDRLAFSWHQSCCTDVGLKSPDNQLKPLFMKDLSKLWRKGKEDLPWNEGDYGPSNTLLVDDTPYKAILNPPNTGIFPRPYSVQDRGDDFLGGALRSYLEGILDAPHVQIYVENNPFGEPSITAENPLWSQVNEVLQRVQNVLSTVGDKLAEVVPVEIVCDDGLQTCRQRISRQKERDGHEDPLQPIKDDMKLPKNDQLSLGSTHVDPVTSHGNCRKEVQTRPSLQLEDQQVFEGATEGSTGKGQAGQVEEKEKDLTTDEETNCKQHESSEERGNEIYTPGEQFDENSQLSPSKSKCMEAADIQKQSHEEESHKKHPWLTQRTDGPECTSNDFKGAHHQLHHSNYRRKKHKMFQGEPAAVQNKRSYIGRDNVDGRQYWKRQKRCYQKDNSCGQYRNMKRWSYQDDHRDSQGYGHSSNSERVRHPGAILPSFNGLQQRKEYENRGHIINDTDEGFGNRNTPLDSNAHYSRGQSHGNRQLGDPAEYFHGSNRVSPNRMIHMNYMGQSYGHAGIMPPNMYTFDQDGFAPSYQHHKSFYASTPKVSGPHPETIEDWSLRGWHPYSGKRDGRGPRGPYRDHGAHSHPYTRGSGAPSPLYQSNGASKRWHRFNGNERKEGGTPWGYNRSRQH